MAVAYHQPSVCQVTVATRFEVSVLFFKKLLRHEHQTNSFAAKSAKGSRLHYLDAEA